MQTKKAELLNRFLKYLRMKNYADSTIRSYYHALCYYWKWCEKEVESNQGFDKTEAAMSYLAYRMKIQKLDFSTVNTDYSALQHFYKAILGRPWNVEKLCRPRSEKRLVRYISPQQVVCLIENAPGLKYKVIFILLYSTGIRISEVLALTWQHLDFDNGKILIVDGKGHRDRLVIFSKDLQQLMMEYKPPFARASEYVFFGYRPTEKTASRTLQLVFANTRKKANLPDFVSAHVLRHSYSTTLVKNGTDLVTLQKLLGHKSIRSTMVYLHLDQQHFDRTYNPLSDPCLSAILSVPQSKIPSDTASERTDMNIFD